MELGDTVQRYNVRVSDALQIAWNSLSQSLSSWVIITLVYFVLAWGGALALQGLVVSLFGGGGAALVDGGGEPGIGMLLGAAVGNLLAGSIASLWLGLLTLGYWGAALRGALGLPVRVGDLFAQFRKFMKYLVQTFFVQLINGVFAIMALAVFGIALLDMLDIASLLDTQFSDLSQHFNTEFLVRLLQRTGWVVMLIAIPSLYVFLGLYFAQLELTYNDESGPVSSIVHSWRITSKHRLQVLGLSVVLGIFLVAGAIPCGLGLIVAIPFAALSLAALFLALRSGADVPPADTTMTLRGEPLPRRGGNITAIDGDDAPGGALR